MKVDLHTHTVASGHAFGTLLENVREAKTKGIELLAVTDHGPAGIGAPRDVYFKVGFRLPKYIEGVRVLFGIEANIIDTEGHLDLSDEVLKKLDVVMLGFHKDCGYLDQGIEKNTEVFIKALDNPYVKAVSHPYGDQVVIDIEKFTHAAISKNILLELNASFFTPKKINDEEIWNRIKTMVRILKENNQKMIINSDAHTPYEIGEFDLVVDKFKELGITESDLLNNDPEAVLKFFNLS